MAAKKYPYLNRHNGDVAILTKREAKRLSEDWEKIEFTTNAEGKPIMRLHLEGATVDVSENEDIEVVPDGIGSAE